MIDIIINDPAGTKIKREVLEFIAHSAIRQLGYQDYDLSIACESEKTVRELNNRYRNIDRPTDVLSFPSGDTNPESGRVYLGDVVLSLSIIYQQAQEIGNDLITELAMVVVHGILHLVGYDHEEHAESDDMFQLQNRILSSIDLKEVRSTSFLKTFRNAFQGFLSAYKTEKNLKIHLSFTVLAVLSGFLLGLSSLEWGLLCLTIAMVFVAEFMNTAVEYVVNLASPQYSELAKKSKDISAAGVLIAVISSLLVGGLLFLPRLIEFLSSTFLRQ